MPADDDWFPICVLPNVPMETAIECDLAALAPAHDLRVMQLKRAHPTFKRFWAVSPTVSGCGSSPTSCLFEPTRQTRSAPRPVWPAFVI